MNPLYKKFLKKHKETGCHYYTFYKKIGFWKFEDKPYIAEFFEKNIYANGETLEGAFENLYEKLIGIATRHGAWAHNAKFLLGHVKDEIDLAPPIGRDLPPCWESWESRDEYLQKVVDWHIGELSCYWYPTLFWIGDLLVRMDMEHWEKVKRPKNPKVKK